MSSTSESSTSTATDTETEMKRNYRAFLGNEKNRQPPKYIPSTEVIMGLDVMHDMMGLSRKRKPTIRIIEKSPTGPMFVLGAIIGAIATKIMLR